MKEDTQKKELANKGWGTVKDQKVIMLKMKTESNINEVTEEITDHGWHSTIQETLEKQREEWAKHKWGKDDHVPEQVMLEK